MISQITGEFRKSFEKLPEVIKQLAKKNYKLWHQDPSHKSLKYKKINTTREIYSNKNWQKL